VMDAADRVAGGDYSVRVAEHGPPSVRALARAFNTMTARLASHDRQRRDLIADVAHELRTPLTVLQGRLEGLLDGVYPRSDHELAGLLQETKVLSRLIDDLRTLALSESGALKLEKEVADVAGLARDVTRQFETDAAAHGIRLEVDVRGQPPAVPIDPVRVREVLSNLLSNALRHTPGGGRIEVRVAPAADGGIEIAVQDTGTGMTPEQVARAFDRFHKGPDSRGTGLGLTIARSLVAAHGGAIRLTSEPGRGTTVIFTLPREAES
jgi:signal transduction histidine kinase